MQKRPLAKLNQIGAHPLQINRRSKRYKSFVYRSQEWLTLLNEAERQLKPPPLEHSKLCSYTEEQLLLTFWRAFGPAAQRIVVSYASMVGVFLQSHVDAPLTK